MFIESGCPRAAGSAPVACPCSRGGRSLGFSMVLGATPAIGVPAVGLRCRGSAM